MVYERLVVELLPLNWAAWFSGHFIWLWATLFYFMGAISECVGPGSKAAEVRRVLPMEKCAVFLVFDAHLCGAHRRWLGSIRALKHWEGCEHNMHALFKVGPIISKEMLWINQSIKWSKHLLLSWGHPWLYNGAVILQENDVFFILKN